jgi:hypothetical protein
MFICVDFMYVFEAYVRFICLCTIYLRMYGIFVCVFLFTYNLLLNTMCYVRCIHLFIFDLCLVFYVCFIYLCLFLCVMFYLWFIYLCSILI